MLGSQEKVTFEVPTIDQVSVKNQAIFDQMQKAFGTVPNLYATFALNDTALADYLALQNRKKYMYYSAIVIHKVF